MGRRREELMVETQGGLLFIAAIYVARQMFVSEAILMTRMKELLL